MSAQGTQINDRKDFLILLLAAAGEEPHEPIVGITRIQKFLFLLQQSYEWDRKFSLPDPYHFEAYDYGPFDSQIYDDVAFLENAGLVERAEGGPEPTAEDGEMRHQSFEWNATDREFQPWEDQTAIPVFRLTERGRGFAESYALSDDDAQVLADLKKQWNSVPLNDLLAWLYNEFPPYAAATKLHHLKPEAS